MIPKIFHHTWPSGGPFKERFIKYRESFMKLHPDYSFMFWTLEDIHNYALSTLSKYLQLDCKLHYVIISDLMRHEIMYRYGGIYVDTDTECLKSFDCFRKYESFGGMSWPPNGSGNGIFGSVPKNPIFKEISKGIISQIMKFGIKETMQRPEHITGPEYTKQFLGKLEHQEPVESFYPFKWDDIDRNRGQDMRLLYPDAYCVHWWSGMDDGGWTRERGISH